MITKVVSTEEVYSQVKTYLGNFVRFGNEYEATMTALFVLVTWVFEEFEFCPYLMISGERGTGKTTLVTALSKVCNKSRMFDAFDTSISHILKKGRGTIFIDPMIEITKPGNLNEMVQYLQAGASGKEAKNGNKSFAEQQFDVFGPKVIVVYDAENCDPFVASSSLKIRLEPVSWEELSISQALPSTKSMEGRASPIVSDLELWGYQFRHRISRVQSELHELLSHLHTIWKPNLPMLAVANDIGSKDLLDLILKPNK